MFVVNILWTRDWASYENSIQLTRPHPQQHVRTHCAVTWGQCFFPLAWCELQRKAASLSSLSHTLTQAARAHREVAKQETSRLRANRFKFKLRKSVGVPGFFPPAQTSSQNSHRVKTQMVFWCTSCKYELGFQGRWSLGHGCHKGWHDFSHLLLVPVLAPSS